MALTVSQILDIAKISQYISTIDVANGSLFGQRVVPETPQILYNERKAVEWLYNLNPADTSLTETSNYLYSLCRGYNLQAQQVSGTGGIITPVNPTQIPNPIMFEVSPTTIFPTGATSAIITPFIGFNILFVRNGIPQSTLNINGDSYFSWTKNLGLLTIHPAAIEGEIFQLYPI
jgi:hypothetical protein